MATWDDLKEDLFRLREHNPGALAGYPDPNVDRDRQPPFRVSLAPWATDVAEDLHRRFGSDVALVVGALNYPSCTLHRPFHELPTVSDLDSAELTAELDGPLVIRSGHTERHGLLVHNASEHEVSISTNGQLTAVVVDLATGSLIGGFTGAHRLPMVMFRVTPRATQRIPLLVGTASFVPDLGYATPPGQWALQVTMDVGGLRPARILPLPFTVTD
jgi:hypothetical protein